MVIIKFEGGLGNQMFQYALYKRLEDKGMDCLVDLNHYKLCKEHNGFELEQVFDLNVQRATSTQIYTFIKKNWIYNKLLAKWLGITKPIYIRENWGNKGCFQPYILQLNDNVYLDGFWQSEKYFADINGLIRKDFAFKNIKDAKNIKLAVRLQAENSVAIHVRRGDYVDNPVHDTFSAKYYHRAFKLIDERVQSIRYYLFSDAPDWCRQEFAGLADRITFVEFNKGADSYKDMYLMSLCKHNIIANSSFSWWGAWLNANPQKIVIAPSAWFVGNKLCTKDLIPENWLRI